MLRLLMRKTPWCQRRGLRVSSHHRRGLRVSSHHRSELLVRRRQWRGQRRKLRVEAGWERRGATTELRQERQRVRLWRRRHRLRVARTVERKRPRRSRRRTMRLRD